jgi:hypothetical protein
VTLTAPALHRYAGPPSVPGYVVDEFLGRGSTGVVWAATRRDTGERVALKLLEPEVDRVDLEAVDREESLGRRVSGAHVLGVRARVTLEDGRVALVMGLAAGGSLRDVVTIRGALPLGEVVTALTPLATALAALHEEGVVHVDVSPGNVLFTPDGRPVLVDLSSAWLVEDGWPRRPLGTSGFAAPEVVLGRPPVPASDVWSLGALAWYARTGGATPPPWVGDLHWSRGRAGGGTSGDPAGEGFESGTVADVVAAVGPELAPLLVRMLADDAEVRPTPGEVAHALYRAAAPEPVGLVGHHPDPAAAVTTRIRREAAETRSRAELREMERAAARRERREGRRRRASAWLAPWAKGRGSSASAGSSGVSSWRSRVIVAGVVGVVLAVGLLTLLRLNGGPSEVATASVADISSSSSGTANIAATGSRSDPVDTAAVNGPAAPAAPAASAAPAERAERADRAAAPSTSSPAVAGMASSDDVVRDPVAALQRVADVRARALVAADPVLLASAEPTGSGAYVNDVRTVDRLREQGQRYADLSFTVRSAEVTSVSPTAVVLRAVVDRSAYTVVGASAVASAPAPPSGGGDQEVGPGPGVPLRYTLSATDGAWRLSDVGPP